MDQDDVARLRELVRCDQSAVADAAVACLDAVIQAMDVGIPTMTLLTTEGEWAGYTQEQVLAGAQLTASIAWHSPAV